MKSFLLLLLHVSAVLCITSNAAVYYNRGQPLLISASNQECDDLIFTELCLNGLLQEYANMAPFYGFPDESRGARDVCHRNNKGIFCVAIDTNMLQSNIETACKNFALGCTEECRDLVIRARNELGCCVNIYNSSNVLLYSYELWTSCGVELVTTRCQPSTITVPQVYPPRPMDVIPFFTHKYSIFCRRRYAEYIRARLSATEDCHDYPYPKPDVCTANSNGAYCLPLLNSPYNDTLGSQNCNDTSRCDPSCMETLESITINIGCCINDLYNNTDNDWLSYEFWSMCGLISPGNCELHLNDDPPFVPPSDQPFTDAAVNMRASSFAITFAVTISVMLQ